MRICYNFPSRSRPEKFFASLDNIKFFSESSNYFIIAKLDDDDETMNENIKTKIGIEYPEVIIKQGHSSGKVHAINRELTNLPEYDLLLTHSDDMFFVEYGYDNEIRKAFDNFKGLVHFPDQKAGELLCTYPMMHREYFEKLGYVYHPDFMSVYCDNFQQWQAQQLNMYKFINKKILEHRHAIWGFGVKDALLERNENPEGYEKDRQTFERLKAII